MTTVYFPKNKNNPLLVKYTVAPNKSIHILYNTSLNFNKPSRAHIPYPISKAYLARFRNKYIPIYVPNVPRR
jgi:hypothetical protein